ncbi:MAG: YtxH domain-containing protein [Coriobacteriia bacterium]|nr:YtxH domain-containing protein [Coriobacteriia bacterium]
MFKCGKFLAGGIIGAAIGILFAPKSGAETRAFIKEKAQAYMDNADVMSDNVRDRAVELYSSASGYAGDATAQLKDRIDTVRSRTADGDATNAAAPTPANVSAPAPASTAPAAVPQTTTGKASPAGATASTAKKT